MLDAGIDVISTVNVQHLESLNDAMFELTGIRVRETFPDRVLDDADEVVLVDLPRRRSRSGSGGQGLSAASARASRSTTSSGTRSSRRSASSRCARWRGRGERRAARTLEPLGQQAVGERVLAMVEPQPKSQRILRRAWRSAQRLGADIDAVWVRAPAGRRRRRRRRSSRRCGASPACSASTSWRRRATTSSPPCAGSPRSAAPPTSSSARPTSRAAARSSAARCCRGWCASSPASTSASSRTAPTGTG